MQEIERTEEMLHKSLKELNDKGDYNNTSLDIIGKVIDALKDIHEIKGNPSYGRGGWTAEGSYGRMPDYRGYGRRDGDGDGRYYEGYNRTYGHNDDIVEGLHRDLQNAKNEEEREYIRKMIRKYEK